MRAPQKDKHLRTLSFRLLGAFSIMWLQLHTTADLIIWKLHYHPAQLHAIDSCFYMRDDPAACAHRKDKDICLQLVTTA